MPFLPFDESAHATSIMKALRATLPLRGFKTPPDRRMMAKSHVFGKYDMKKLTNAGNDFEQITKVTLS